MIEKLLGKTSEDFRFIFFLREAQEKNKQKIRSHQGPAPQVSGRLCEAKPEAKSYRDGLLIRRNFIQNHLSSRLIPTILKKVLSF